MCIFASCFKNTSEILHLADQYVKTSENITILQNIEQIESFEMTLNISNKIVEEKENIATIQKYLNELNYNISKETDKIKIRQVTNEESDTFYQKYSSIIECFKNNEKIGQICVAKVGNFDGLTLTADMSRANEDIEIVYDDEDDFDDSDEDFEDDDSEDDDLGDFDDNAQK